MIATTGQLSANTVTDFRSITEPVSSLLDDLQIFLRAEINHFEPEIQELVAYCLRNSGKRIRPVLVFLSGISDDPHIRKRLVKAAAVVELVHLATLIHDDILDAAKIRHNLETVSEKFGSDVAVLLGDAVFAQALKLAAEFPTVEICRVVSHATQRVCAGEIAQTFQRGKPDLSLKRYYRIIDLKTAELFSVSCRLGALLSDFDRTEVELMARFGRHLGIAYQIYDDVADIFGREEHAGKTLGTDLVSGKFTLPLLLYLDQLGEEGRAAFLAALAGREVDETFLRHELTKSDSHGRLLKHFEKELKQAEQALDELREGASVAQMRLLCEFVQVQIGRFFPRD